MGDCLGSTLPLDPVCAMFPLRSPVWLIEINHPELGHSSFLQTEGERGTYLLVFTSARKAKQAIDGLGVEHSYSACLFRDVQLELATALCQAGALGVVVDLDPDSRRAAFSWDLLARA
jgi:hypothetical protein